MMAVADAASTLVGRCIRSCSQEGAALSSGSDLTHPRLQPIAAPDRLAMLYAHPLSLLLFVCLFVFCDIPLFLSFPLYSVCVSVCAPVVSPWLSFSVLFLSVCFLLLLRFVRCFQIHGFSDSFSVCMHARNQWHIRSSRTCERPTQLAQCRRC